MTTRRRIGAESALRRKRLLITGSDAGVPPSFFVQPVGSEPASDGLDVPDLLHAKPRAWGDLSGSVELVRFAFEGGDCEGVFDALVEALPLAPSVFSGGAKGGESVGAQLYLDELVASCMKVSVRSERFEPSTKVLRRILESPPERGEDCAARQAVLAELVAEPRLREELGAAYVALRRLRSALEMSTESEPNLVRRKVGVLVALRHAVETIASSFEGAESALVRLRDAAGRIRATDAWTRLVELVDAEGNLAQVDLRLQLGSDGTVRGFDVLAIRERSATHLFPGPVWRFIQRIVSFFRGYRYGESEVVVRLLDTVFSPLADGAVSLLATTGAIELYVAAMGFRDLAASKGLGVCLPEIREASGGSSHERVIEGLFNPLLFLQGVTPIPCDLPVQAHDALVVITGPNSGGKTRLLQSLALVQLLGQVGLFVPAKRASIVRAPNLFCSLVADGDAAQIEGRLGTELMRIRRLFEQLQPGSMAILDELCSGTNPMEGEQIFEMVVSLLPRLRPQVFVSTHFLGLAARLEREPPVESLAFLEVELDDDEKPTFRFVPGVAATSLAHKVAERLGVTEAELSALVSSKLSS